MWSEFHSLISKCDQTFTLSPINLVPGVTYLQHVEPTLCDLDSCASCLRTWVGGCGFSSCTFMTNWEAKPLHLTIIAVFTVEKVRLLWLFVSVRWLVFSLCQVLDSYFLHILFLSNFVSFEIYSEDCIWQDQRGSSWVSLLFICCMLCLWILLSCSVIEYKLIKFATKFQ